MMDDIENLKETLKHNIAAVQERIAEACQRVGRNPTEIKLVAVSKMVDVTRIETAYGLGLHDFGENWVQEAAAKIPQIEAPATWHLIGHLQTNKAKRAVELFDVIQSVDSVRIAQAISTAAASAGKEMPVLLEVNVSGEPTKYGFSPEDISAAVDDIARLPAIRIQGLMTIAAIVGHPDEARPYFAKLRQLRDNLRSTYPNIDWQHLSMGMTDDFEVAIEEGATIVRIGRAIFGERPHKD